jgi:hypothetical protein
MTISNSFVPNRQSIASITNANPGVVTTTQNHGYFSGAYVRLVFPKSFGMPEVNGQVFLIIVLSPTTFAIDENTTNFAPFTIASSLQTAQVIPVGEIAETLISAEKNNYNIVPET